MTAPFGPPLAGVCPDLQVPWAFYKTKCPTHMRFLHAVATGGKLLQVTRSPLIWESEDAGYNCYKFHARDFVLHCN